MKVLFDETMIRSDGSVVLESHAKRLREKAEELFLGLFDVHVSFFPFGKTAYAVLMSNCSVVVLNKALETIFVGQLESLLRVDWRAPRLLSGHKVDLVFADASHSLEFVTGMKSEPSFCSRLRDQIRIRREGQVTLTCGLFGNSSRDDLTPVSVALHADSGKLLPDIAESLPKSQEDPALPMSVVLPALIHWEVLSGDYVQEGQYIGEFCGSMLKAPAAGRIWIAAPAGFSDRRAAQGESTLAAQLPSEAWFADQQMFWDIRTVLSTPGLSNEWNLAIIEACEVPDHLRHALPPVMTVIPEGILIRQPSDAEKAAATWMRYWGWTDAQETGAGTDGGKDVVASDAIAQVKAHMNPIGRPDLQNLYGVSAAEGKQGLFFSLMGYTKQARDWADEVSLPLFRFDLQGIPEPLNSAALMALEDKKTEWRDRAQDDADEQDALDEEDEDEDEDEESSLLSGAD